MKKNVLGGSYKQFERYQHTKIHLSNLKAQYIAKIEVFPDGVSFQSFSFSSCLTICTEITGSAS